MKADSIRKILDDVQNGKMNADEAFEKIRRFPLETEDLGYATVDHSRGLRLGLGEVIYGEGKGVDQIEGIAGKLSLSGEPILITRLSDDKLKVLKKKFPGGRVNSLARTYTINPIPSKDKPADEPYVCIVTAGTSDIPVAEEAADVCAAMGVAFTRLYDVGVAGIHRVMNKVDIMQKAAAVVVIAGMEGALPSVVGGLVSRPIFAVPTDVGYGANLKGLTALLSMLSSCAPGIAVTNINAGFSAAYAACRVVNAVRESMKKLPAEGPRELKKSAPAR
ncbi:MAG TPA: nickel pincer cofactor biosynthesis protein LarB [Candidatus Kryptonia bacterium]